MKKSLSNRTLKYFLLKLLLVFCTLIYIYIKFLDAYESNVFKIKLTSHTTPYLLVSTILIFVNWGIEALKWKLLLARHEKISFGLSLKSVLTGVAISIFTPNRIGEFAARILFLKNKLNAAVISLLGSLLQLSVTIILGIAAYLILLSDASNPSLLAFINYRSLIFPTISCLIIILLTLLYLRNRRIPDKIHSLFQILKSYSFNEILLVWCLSLVRFLVFSTQFLLLLKGLGFAANWFDIYIMIAIIFIITSAIPTFAITEIAVRSATSVYFLGMLNPEPVIITTASILLWIFNIVIPAIIGSVFIAKLDLASQKL